MLLRLVSGHVYCPYSSLKFLAFDNVSLFNGSTSENDIHVKHNEQNEYMYKFQSYLTLHLRNRLMFVIKLSRDLMILPLIF